MGGGVASKPLRWIFKSSLPKTDGTFTAELEEPASASILRDSYGVPHLTASSEKDLWFLNGVVHGQDRLWQLHSARMMASGRLCEFAGAKALDLDRLLRQMGLRRLAEEDLSEMQASDNPDVRLALEMIEAYVRGVNWAFNQASMMPVEFWLTGQRRIDPWTVVDSLAVMRLYGFVMCFGFQQTIVRQALVEIFGRERALAWTNTVEQEDTIPCTVNEEASKAFRSANLSGAVGSASMELPRGQGSNWWVIHGSHTTTGMPLLVGDPHLTIKIPTFWYETHFRQVSSDGSTPINAYGVAPPGIPGVFVGTTGFYATSITLAYTDVEDMFLECVRNDGKYLYKGEWHECSVCEETINVKGAASEKVLCRSTRHGVLFEGGSLLRFEPLAKIFKDSRLPSGVSEHDECAVCFAYAGLPLRPKSNGLLGIRKLLFARSFAEFDASLAAVSHVIALNFGYADIEGHIGYVLTGEVPRRSGSRGAELYPLIGWTGENDWNGFVSHAELPKAFDPPSGIIISANHKIVDYDSSPHYLGSIWKSGYRAQSIDHELRNLLKTGKLSPEQMPGVLMNVKSWAAVSFVEVIQSVQPESDTADALNMLKAWDGVLHQDSIPATIYQFAHAELFKLLFRSGFEAQARDASLDSILTNIGLDTTQEIVSGDGFDPSSNLKILNELQGHLHLNILRILRSTDDEANNGLRWWLEQAGGKDAAVNAAIRAAIAMLQRVAGDHWQTSGQASWGAVHMCHIVHPISTKLGLTPGSQPFDIESRGQGGDTNTIMQTATRSMSDFTATASNVSLRVIFDLSDLSSEDTNRIITPCGQSGQFNSQHYSDQNSLWHEGQFRAVVTRQASFESAAVSTMRFTSAHSRV